jgi:hypothetical protein
MARFEKGSGTAGGAGAGRYPRGQFDACYWRLADLCELAVDLPVAQEWPILEAFEQIAEIGTPRHLRLADLNDSDRQAARRPGIVVVSPSPTSHTGTSAEASGLAAAVGSGGSAAPTAVRGQAEAETVAAEVLQRVAGLAPRAGTLDEALAWDRVHELVATAFPHLCHGDRPGWCGEPDALA